MKAKKYLMLMATMFAMMLLAAACTEKNIVEPEEPEEPTTPENPVNPGDWHTVPVSGGDISVDNFTISLPSGTFTSETRMAITKEEKGHICGENEVTNFYQITSPVTTHKPMTVKVASEELGDGYCLVFHAQSFLQSGEEPSYSNVYLKTTYADGAYTATIPEANNDGDDGNEENEEGEKTLSFSIGLVKAPSISQSDTRGLFSSEPQVLQKGQVEDVKWVLYVDPSLNGNDTIWNVFTEDIHVALGQYISASLKTLLDLGFKLKNQKDRVIPFYYKRYFVKKGYAQVQWNTSEIDPSLYGGFEPSSWSNDYNIITLGVDKLGEDLTRYGHVSLKTTVIHELFHYFQYELDSRSQINKGSGYWMDNRSILYEMASVWSEHFMNDGELNAMFLDEHLYGTDDVANLGIGQEDVRFQGVGNVMAEQGYTLGPWLYFLVKEIDRLGLRHPNKHPVFELFELYKKNWVDGTHNAYYIIQEWLDSYADEKMLYKNITWDDYYLQLWRGELVKDFCVNDLKLPKYADQRTYMFRNDFKAIPYENECYPYGCCINKFMISDYRDIDLSGKELVIKQDTPGLASYLIWASDENKDSNKYNIYQRDQEAFDASIEDSIVIRGKELEALRMSNGSFSHRLYVITTNTYSYLSLTNSIR